MDKQEQGKLILWKDLDILPQILKEELFLGQQNRFFNIQKIRAMNKQNLWLEHHTYKYIMKLSKICYKATESVQASEKIKKKGVYVEGLSEWAVRTPKEIYKLI